MEKDSEMIEGLHHCTIGPLNLEVPGFGEFPASPGVKTIQMTE
jgi:hypothetical protein